MDVREQKVVLVDERLSKEPEMARWLWAFQDTRHLTLEALDGLTQATIDWLPPDNGSSMGTVLYHLALIEADWLYAEVLVQEYPPAVAALFPYADRDEQRQLMQVQGVRLAEHLSRLETVRGLVLGV